MRRIRPQPRFWLLLAGAMVLTFLCSGCAHCLRFERSRFRLNQLQSEKAALEETIARLQDQLEYTRSDAWAEQIARSELNMIYPGEIRYVLGK